MSARSARLWVLGSLWARVQGHRESLVGESADKDSGAQRHGRFYRNARTGGGAMERPWRQMGAQLTTDKLAPAILVMPQHILLLKYRRGELHLGATWARLLNGGPPPPGSL